MSFTYEESFGIIPLAREKSGWKVLLILHQGGNHWSYPKGKRLADEEPIEAARRELKEETDLDVEQFLRTTPYVEQYQFRRKGHNILKKVHYFPAIVKGKVRLQIEEVKEARWVSLTEAQNLLTFIEARNILSSVAEVIKGIAENESSSSAQTN
jgi:8-oxo-dGTP pyrophosphatase MutT (NUDIX family)